MRGLVRCYSWFKGKLKESHVYNGKNGQYSQGSKKLSLLWTQFTCLWARITCIPINILQLTEF